VRPSYTVKKERDINDFYSKGGILFYQGIMFDSELSADKHCIDWVKIKAGILSVFT